MKQVAGRWGPVLGWMGLIFVLSHQSALPLLAPTALQDLVSTATHALEYAVFSALLFRAAVRFPERPGLPVGLALWVIASLYGVTDEFHQSFVLNRTASIGDLLADASGALLGLTLYYLWRTRRSV